MTDEQQESTNQENNPSIEANPPSETPATDEIDVVSALAALSSLHDFVEEEVNESEADESEAEDDESDLILASESDDYADYAEIERQHSDFPHPPVSVLHRGQIASIVPAAVLIGAGGLLTVMLTTSADASLNLPLVGMLAMSGLGLVLITHWLSSSRWTIGSFFVGMVLLLMGGMGAYLLLPNNLNFVQGWPLLLTAVGTAFVLTDLVSPAQSRLWIVGLLLALIGFSGLVITGNFLAPSIIQFVSRLWPVALAIVAFLLIMPIFRRNG